MILENNRILLDNNRIIENLGVYSVPGLVLWHDASQLQLSNDQNVSGVTEKSGTGFNFIQQDIRRQPKYKTNIINGFGSISYELNTVDFLAGNQGTLFGSKTGSQSYFNGRVVEFFWVARFLTTPTNNNLFFHIRSATTPTTVLLRITPTNRFSLTSTDDSSNVITTTLNNVLNPNQWYLFYALVDFTGTFNRTLTVDSVGTISATSVNSFTFTTSHNFRYGASGNTSVIQSPESIICSNPAPLTTGNRNIINDYLKTKYNI